MNALQSLHDQTDEAFARRLFDALPAMRRGPGDKSTPVQSTAGSDAVSTDTPQATDAGSDSASCEVGGVEV